MSLAGAPKTLPPRNPTAPSPPYLHTCLMGGWRWPQWCSDLRRVIIPKKYFHPFKAFLIRTPHHATAKAAEKLCPDLEVFPLPLPHTHCPVYPSCPDRPSALLRKVDEQAEMPPGRLCTHPPSCKPKWKARMLPKTASEKNGLTREVVKATWELHRCSNSFYLVNITSTAQEEAHERRCLFCN